MIVKNYFVMNIDMEIVMNVNLKKNKTNNNYLFKLVIKKVRNVYNVKQKLLYISFFDIDSSKFSKRFLIFFAFKYPSLYY